MHDSSFNDTHLVARYLLKLNDAINSKTEHYFTSFLVIKHLLVFIMSDLSIEL